MEQLKHFNMTEERKDALISLAYGDSSFPDKIKIYVWMISNPEARSFYNGHKKIAKASRALKNNVKCPEEVIAKTYTSLNLKKEKGHIYENFYSLVFTKPVLSLAAIVLIVSLMFIPDLINRTTPRKYSEQEVAEARRQAEATLAYVGIVLEKAEKAAVEETLYGRVSKPINDNLNSLNILLGGEYETSN